MNFLSNYFAILILSSIMLLVGIFLMVRYGYMPGMKWFKKQEARYDQVLRRQLLIDIDPRVIVILNLVGVGVMFLIGTLLAGILFGIGMGALFLLVPYAVIRHMETKRRQKLEIQLVDGLASLASGVRAGLNLVQSMQLLVQNQRGPIQQEFSQILREYEMGMDLNQAMRAASNRIGSSLYRLTFTAIEMHRIRGGDSGQSMDRIAESIRDIQRLEGKLDAMTSQGRMQANFMAIMPFVIIGILLTIMPEETTELFVTMSGRILLLIALGMIVAGYLWIRKIMQIDI